MTTHEKLIEWATHRLSRELLVSLRNGGWFVQEVDPRVRSVQFAHPNNSIEIETPDYVPASWCTSAIIGLQGSS
jgi:hypothetical protein